MTNKQKPKLLSLSEIGRRVGLHRHTVAERLRGLGYQPDPSSTLKCQLFLFDDHMAFALRSARDSMSAARLRNLIADVQLKELKLAVSRGELILINDAVEFAYKRLNAIYTELTLRRPKRLARRIAKCKTAAEVTKILKADAELIRTGLQKDFPEISIPLENG